MAKTIKVVDVSSTDAGKDEEVEHVEPVVEPTAEVEPESDKRTIKTVELYECEKCGKKLTARTLKYSHASKCSHGDSKPQQAQTPKPATQRTDKKQSEAVSAKEPEPKPILTAYEMRMLKIRERQEKIRQLASQAF